MKVSETDRNGDMVTFVITGNRIPCSLWDECVKGWFDSALRHSLTMMAFVSVLGSDIRTFLGQVEK